VSRPHRPASRARYVPYAEVGARPNIVVDGAALPSTVLTLSHWPNNSTPEALKRDTSTATVFAYLAAPTGHRPCAIVTNNHFDEDGLFSMYALLRPAEARRHERLLTDASFAGDFGTFRDRAAARLCFAIEAFVDPASALLPRRVFATSGKARVAALYRALLPRLPKLLRDASCCRRHWQAEDEHLRESERLVAEGRVAIEEEPELDLAIVRIPIGLPARRVRRYLHGESAAIHPFAIHNATRCTRLVRIQGRRIELQYRYESWLQIPSRRPAGRVDLTPFRRWLDRHDGGGWTWQDTLALAPRLYRADGRPSGVSPEAFLRELRAALRNLPTAWDAYDWKPARRA
jgi:hypothetical protein